ncbi:hypothetical protein M378DRAFT_158020 [Amanita muscaria Koide BX008]|uniref:RING-type domain-containing protein n=1 Tax=Amanita muscaria (strain Koide BX008) TaxID=946122 RepID=A0A0C2X3W1_AMAMK|nr:hypothetical protein M378DRAFT_158020 [Amanita muscaria Koide BX008]
MPVLRSSKGQQSIEEAFSRDTRTPLTAKRTHPTSSTSSSRTSRSKQAKPKKNKEASEPPKPLPDNEVIEIASDSEDDCTLANAMVIYNLRKEIAHLKDEKVKQKRDLEKYKQNFLKGKLTVDASQVEEILNCEICTGRMWSPYLLSDCGHCFCQTCLQDWFRTVLNKFVAEHPNVDPTHPDWRWQLQPLLLNNPGLLATFPAFNAFNAPRPQYSCPTCRNIITTRPVEVYTLKALVRILASAAGDKSPQKDRNSKKALTTPWDQFFPPSIGRA